MKLYKLPVSWTVMATMEVWANSLEDAVALADGLPLPRETEYLSDSFQVETDGVEVEET